MPQTNTPLEGQLSTTSFDRSPRFADPANRDAVLAGRVARKAAKAARKLGRRHVPGPIPAADLCWAPKDTFTPFEGLPETTDERRTRGSIYRVVMHPGVIVAYNEVKPGTIELPVKLMIELNLPEGQALEYAAAGGKTGVIHFQTGIRDDVIAAHPSTCAAFASASAVRLTAPCSPGRGFSVELKP